MESLLNNGYMWIMPVYKVNEIFSRNIVEYSFVQQRMTYFCPQFCDTNL